MRLRGTTSTHIGQIAEDQTVGGSGEARGHGSQQADHVERAILGGGIAEHLEVAHLLDVLLVLKGLLLLVRIRLVMLGLLFRLVGLTARAIIIKGANHRWLSVVSIDAITLNPNKAPRESRIAPNPLIYP